jgi:hypothetical protein
MGSCLLENAFGKRFWKNAFGKMLLGKYLFD